MTIDPLSIPILASSRGWLVVEKPFGLSVQEELKGNLCSLLQTRIKTDRDLRDRIDCDPGFGLHPVHRLDRETSGVLLLACRAETFRFFARQFEDRRVHKRYVALVHGKLAGPEGEKEWSLWARPLSKEAGGRFRPEGAGAGVPCETRFRVLRRSPHYTLIECDPLTGRKHQIRRHARLAGHAVVGDSRYGTPRSLKFLREEKGFNRLALHSLSLQVRTPAAAVPQVFKSSAIPPEILKLLEEDLETETP